jgi:hypothetical protein
MRFSFDSTLLFLDRSAMRVMDMYVYILILLNFDLLYCI